MRRNIGRHPNRNPGRAVGEQVRKRRRQHHRLVFLLIEIWLKIDRVLVEIAQEFLGNLLEPAFRIPVGGRRVAVDRAEVPLAVDQLIAHAKVLRHAHERVVHGGVAVRMVFTEHFTDDLGAFGVGPVVIQPDLAHRVEHAPIGRLQPVPGVGQGTADNDRHRVIDVSLLHLFADINRGDFFVLGVHGGFLFFR